MKRWLAISLTLLSLPLKAQEKPTAAKPQIEVQTPLPPSKPAAASTNIMELPKEPNISFGGTFTDIKRSTNRWRMFSLKKPLDPKTDQATIIRETRTEAAKPIKLFSIDF